MKNSMYFSQTFLKKKNSAIYSQRNKHTFTLSQKSTKAVKSHFLEYATLYFRIAS